MIREARLTKCGRYYDICYVSEPEYRDTFNDVLKELREYLLIRKNSPSLSQKKDYTPMLGGDRRGK